MSDTGPGTPSGRPLAVLVDDEVLFRLDVEFLLGEAGYEVAEASDAAEALPLIGNGRDCWSPTCGCPASMMASPWRTWRPSATPASPSWWSRPP